MVDSERDPHRQIVKGAEEGELRGVARHSFLVQREK